MAGHKYYIVTNITLLNPREVHCTFAELAFINDKALQTNKTENVIFSSQYNASDIKGINAFDKNPNTITANSPNENYSLYWIGYKFDEPVVLQSVGVQARQDDYINQNWQTADVYYSDDGINRKYYGRIEPKIIGGDKSLKIVDVIRKGSVSGNSKQDDGKISRFVLIDNWDTGGRIAKIVPDGSGNWSIPLETNVKVIVTHIGEDGYRPKADAPIIPVPIE